MLKLLEHLAESGSAGRSRCARRRSSAICASTSKSSAICLAMPGRCTLTTTGRPSRRAARMHLAERGGGDRLRLEARERLRDAHAQLGLRRSARPPRTGTASPCPAAARARRGTAAGSRSARLESTCPSLTNVGPIASRSSARASGLGISPSASVSGPSEPSTSPSSFATSERPYLQNNRTMSR